jgi:hypothetical protein
MHYKKIVLSGISDVNLEEAQNNTNLLLDASNLTGADLLTVLDNLNDLHFKRLKLIAQAEMFQSTELVDKCFQSRVHSFVIILPDSWKNLKNSMEGIGNLYRQSLAHEFPFFLALKINANEENLSELFEYAKLLLGVIPDLLILNLNMALTEDVREMLNRIIKHCETNDVWVKLERIENDFGINAFSWSDEE